MFARKAETEVLVVGAGPVGLFTGLLLARRGVKVRIIDEQWRTAARSYALALHPHTLEILEEAGLAAEVVAAGRRVATVGLYDAAGRQAEVRYGGLASAFPFVLVLPQSALEAALESRLEAAGVEVLWNHRLASLTIGDDGAEASIERLAKASTGYSVAMTEWVVDRTITTRAALVIGADGHRSAVRRAAGIDFPATGPSQEFAVFECTAADDAGGEMRVVLSADTTNVYWPLADGRFRWSFEITERMEPRPARAKSRLSVQIGEQAFPYLAPEGLGHLLAERAPWFDRPVHEVHWSVAVRFETRQAAEPGRGVVSLVGDAAHLAGPVGVQSMNLGLEEARRVAGAAADRIQGLASSGALESLRDELAATWRRLTGPVAATAEASPWVTQRAARIPPCLPASGDDLDHLLRQLGLRLA